MDVCKLKGDNTEVIIVRSRQQLLKVNIPYVKVGDSEIELSLSDRKMEAVFDRIRKAKKILIHAFVAVRIDKLSSLLTAF